MAARWRSCRVNPEVMEKNSGIPPKGFTIGNSARYVAVAPAGIVSSRCSRVLGVLITWSHPNLRLNAESDIIRGHRVSVKPSSYPQTIDAPRVTLNATHGTGVAAKNLHRH